MKCKKCARWRLMRPDRRPNWGDDNANEKYLYWCQNDPEDCTNRIEDVSDGGVNFWPDGEDYCLNRLWFIIFARIFSLSLSLRMCEMWVNAFVSTRMSSDTLVTAFGIITQVRLGFGYKIPSYSSQVHVRVNEWMNSMEALHTTYFEPNCKEISFRMKCVTSQWSNWDECMKCHRFLRDLTRQSFISD